jgi:ABC-type transport system involved in cytochrome c biogenesis permease subunit
MKTKLKDFPVAFLTIGIAIGMATMTLLFFHFEETIKSWAGFSNLSLLLIVVYLIIAIALTRSYRKATLVFEK